MTAAAGRLAPEAPPPGEGRGFASPIASSAVSALEGRKGKIRTEFMCLSISTRVNERAAFSGNREVIFREPLMSFPECLSFLSEGEAE